MLVVEILLELGLPPDGFDELIELLRLGWEPFLTDADLEAGLDAIELLASFRANASRTLDLFANPILSRIGPHNARRIPETTLEVAADLASEFGLALELPQKTMATGTRDLQAPRPLEGTVVVLYSLMSNALDRAAAILERRHSGLAVVTLSDHVATDRLRNAARTADLVIVMDRAAKHAATDAVRVARGNRALRYATGKGSVSLVAAAEEGLDAIGLL